jgi:hypothetical protein
MIAYSGKVKIKTMLGESELNSLTIHNTGTNELFKELLSSMVNSKVAPRYNVLRLFNVDLTKDVAEEIEKCMTDDVSSAAKQTSYMDISSNTASISFDNNVWEATFKFNINWNEYAPDKDTNVIAVFSAAKSTKPFAYIILENSIRSSTNESKIIDWTISFKSV